MKWLMLAILVARQADAHVRSLFIGRHSICENPKPACMGHKLRVRLAILGYTRPASHVKIGRGSHCDADFLHIEHLADIERFCDCIKILLRNYYAPMVKREKGVYKAEGKACREQVLPHTSTILAKSLIISPFLHGVISPSLPHTSTILALLSLSMSHHLTILAPSMHGVSMLHRTILT